MNWKFWERVPVETRDYSVNTRDALVNAALGEVAIKNSRPAIIEACSGLWSRAFASATVTPQTPATAALTPHVLATVGRRLYEKGQVVFEISLNPDGSVKLIEASSHNVTGTDQWIYRLTIPQPDAVVTRFRPAAGVVHLRYAETASQPWAGRGPVDNSNTSRDLARALELRLSQEANSSVGNVIPSPESAQDSDLQADISGLKGGNVLVPSMRNEDYTGGGTPPRNDWMPQRLGANWPSTLQPMRASVNSDLAAAAGVPATLLATGGDATSMREAWRIFLFSSVAPLGRILLEELRAKLEEPTLNFDWKELAASDIQGRSRAFGSLVQGGMDPQQAADVTGVVAEGETVMVMQEQQEQEQQQEAVNA